MKHLLAVAVFTLIAGLAFAQNAPLPTQTWSTTFSPVALPGGGTTFAGSLADVGVSFTPNTNLFLETIQSPGVDNYNGFYGAGFSYQINALSKALNNIMPVQSGYRFRFTLIGSAGEARVGDKNHFSGTARFRTEYALTTSGSYNLAVEVGAGRLYTSPGWQKMIAFGPSFHF